MTDLGLPHHQLATLLAALASIDRRLGRIEAALDLSSFTDSSHAAVPSSSVSSSTGPANPAIALQQAGRQRQHLAPAPPAAPPPPLPQQAPVLLSNAAVVPSHAPPPQGSQAITPLEPPPEGFTLSSRARMQDELDAWTLPRGYSMRIAGAKVTGKRKVRWVCFRGGEARHHHRRRHDRAQPDDGDEEEAALLLQQRAKAEGRRKPTTDRSSKKCGCPFKFEVVETARDADVWVLHYSNGEHRVHNHGPSDTASDPRARKLPGYVLVEVDQWLRDGWLVSKIQEELRARGFPNVLNTDLYNRKRLVKKESGEG